MSVFSKRAEDAVAAELAASVVSYALGTPTQEILSADRGCVRTIYARHVAMYLCHTAFKFSLSRVAVAFWRDRSTAAHACRLIEDRRDEGQYDLWIGSLEEMLRAAPPSFVASDAQI